MSSVRVQDRHHGADGRLRPWLVALALSSLAGFVSANGAVLGYDASVGHGPLASVGHSLVDLTLRFLPVLLGVLVYAIATWQLGIRGALVTFAGFVVVGPFLFFTLSPWSSEPPERLVCCDGVRSLNTLSTSIFGTLGVLIVPPITLLLRKVWRHSRAQASSATR